MSPALWQDASIVDSINGISGQSKPSAWEHPVSYQDGGRFVAHAWPHRSQEPAAKGVWHDRARTPLGVALAVAIPIAALPNEAQRLVGTWRLVSFIVENMDSGERSAAYGERPNGFIIATAEGRFTAIVTGQGRPIPQTDEQRITAFRSMFAYSGPFTIEGNRFTTRAEVSWNESWTGTDQVRFFRFEGNDRLVIETAPAPGPNLGLRMARSVLVWERVR